MEYRDLIKLSQEKTRRQFFKKLRNYIKMHSLQKKAPMTTPSLPSAPLIMISYKITHES